MPGGGVVQNAPPAWYPPAGRSRLHTLHGSGGRHRMQWDQDTIAAIDMALNEAEVVAVELPGSGLRCDLFVHVRALLTAGPIETAPIDPDPRRILRLLAPSRFEVLLRRECSGGPAVPLADVAAVDGLLRALRWSGPMYGWSFLDNPALVGDWPPVPSLRVELPSGSDAHRLYWFTECGMERGEEVVSYCLEGLVTFADLQVLHADGSPQPVADFAAAGRRYWEAYFGRLEQAGADAVATARKTAQLWRPTSARWE